ncbi:transaldolase family protein [Streptomyces sp. NPDC005899]|uniref:transaldolase family protein n=1 Tax=Streptomyces sp. NPDC005899 TaxID=3155716 RepID=UPI0033EDFD21
MNSSPEPGRDDVRGQLAAEGVGLWLDDYHRGRLVDGSLNRLVAGGLALGVASRPAAVARAVSATTAYREQLDRQAGRGLSADERAYALMAEDAREACAVLDPVYRATKGMHGWVSLGIAPGLVTDAAAMVDRSRRLVDMVGRPNVLIRIPVAGRGLAAATELLASRIGVHISSVFSVRRYAQAVEAHFRGLERASRDGSATPPAASLVSLDIGHLNAGVDALLDARADPAAGALRGRAGLTVARLMYRRYEESLGSPRWRPLVAGGALPQRLLWSSENAPACPRAALGRLEQFVAWMTVHALPQSALETLDSVDGLRGDTLSGEYGSACRALDDLGRAGVIMDTVASGLEAAALRRERAAWKELLSAAQAG